MKLHEVITAAKSIIAEISELEGVQIFDDPADMKRKLETAIQERGLALVLIQESGIPTEPSSPDLLLKNLLIVSVLENTKTNTNGPSALQATGLILKAVNQYFWRSPGLKNALTVDNPAYTRGELETGLTTYFCNFLIKTIE